MKGSVAVRRETRSPLGEGCAGRAGHGSLGDFGVNNSLYDICHLVALFVCRAINNPPGVCSRGFIQRSRVLDFKMTRAVHALILNRIFRTVRFFDMKDSGAVWRKTCSPLDKGGAGKAGHGGLGDGGINDSLDDIPYLVAFYVSWAINDPPGVCSGGFIQGRGVLDFEMACPVHVLVLDRVFRAVRFSDMKGSVAVRRETRSPLGEGCAGRTGHRILSDFGINIRRESEISVNG